LLGQLLAQPTTGDVRPQVAVLPLESGRIARVVERSHGQGEAVRDVLLAMQPEQRLAALELRVREHVGRIVKLAAARVEPGRALGSMGMDSLMGQELRHSLEADLSVALSATLVWNYPTVTELVSHLATRLGLSVAAEREHPAPVQVSAPLATSDVVAAIGELSEAEAFAELTRRG
jgi:myxalamid-type polyketide synthase MxaE and MxaD